MRLNVEKMIQRYGMPICLLLMILVLQVINPKVPLLSPLNIKNILMQTTAIALTALGLSYIMIAGEGDMSFAGMFSLLSVIFVLVINRSENLFIGLLVTTCIALIVNGIIVFLVTKMKFSSFIVSISMMFMAIGVEKALHQQTSLIHSKRFTEFAQVNVGLPLIVWIMVLAFLLSYILINKTKYGFGLRIVGENGAAGIEAGINITRVKIVAYIIAGLLIAMGASIESLRVGAIYLQGQNYMLPIFAACYLGSSMFNPGRVNVAGTFVGALFMGIIGSFMKMMSVESYIIPIVQGIILICSVGVVAYRKRDKIEQVKI